MDALLVWVKIAIILFSLYALISFLWAQRRAHTLRKQTIAQGKRSGFASASECQALQLAYQLQLPAQVPTLVLTGEVVAQSLRYQGGNDTFYTIGGARIEVPKVTDIETPLMLEVLDAQMSTTVALVNNKLYLLETPLFSLCEAVADKQLQQHTQNAIDNTRSGKVDALPLVVLAQREANPDERRYLDPIGRGLGYFFTLVVIFALLAWVMRYVDSPWLWALAYALPSLPLVYFWWLNCLRESRSFQITKVRACIDELSDELGQCHARLYAEQGDGAFSLQIPPSWSSAISVGSTAQYEICAERSMLVAIGTTHHVSQLLPPQGVKRQGFWWMALAAIALACSVLMASSYSQLRTSAAMLTQSQSHSLSSYQQFQQHNWQLGQRISLLGPARQCQFEAQSTQPCKRFVVVEQAPTLALDALSESAMYELYPLYRELEFGFISEQQYQWLQLMASYSGETIADRWSIREFNNHTLQNWARWLVAQPSSEPIEFAKQRIAELWQELHDSPCDEDCWQTLVSEEPIATSESSFILWSRLNHFEVLVQDHGAARLRTLRDSWLAQLPSELPANARLIELELALDESHPWLSFNQSLQLANDSLVYDLEDTVAQAQQALIDFSAVPDLDVVVSDVTQSQISLLPQFSRSTHQRHLVQLGLLSLALIWLLLAPVGYWLSREKRLTSSLLVSRA